MFIGLFSYSIQVNIKNKCSNANNSKNFLYLSRSPKLHNFIFVFFIYEDANEEFCDIK